MCQSNPSQEQSQHCYRRHPDRPANITCFLSVSGRKRGKPGLTMAYRSAYILPPVFFFPCFVAPLPPESGVYEAIVRGGLFIGGRPAEVHHLCLCSFLHFPHLSDPVLFMDQGLSFLIMQEAVASTASKKRIRIGLALYIINLFLCTPRY